MSVHVLWEVDETVTERNIKMVLLRRECCFSNVAKRSDVFSTQEVCVQIVVDMD